MAAAKKVKRDDRDGTGFILLPFVVVDSAAFQGLSGPAVRLLIDMARQLRKEGNNGSLTATMATLAKRGWSSNDTLTRARRELEAAGLIQETRKGKRPNTAALFAVTWRGYDFNPAVHELPLRLFERGAYLRKNAPLRPSGGVERPEIAPSGGVGDALSTPSGGAIRGINGASLTPSGGDISRCCHLSGSDCQPIRPTPDPWAKFRTARRFRPPFRLVSNTPSFPIDGRRAVTYH